jgi:hypothetical protein
VPDVVCAAVNAEFVWGPMYCHTEAVASVVDPYMGGWNPVCADHLKVYLRGIELVRQLNDEALEALLRVVDE